MLPTAPHVHAPTTPNWVRPVAGPLYGVSKYFFTSRNPPGTHTENLPSWSSSCSPSSPPLHSPPSAVTFIPALLRDKGYACLYLKATDRMKCTMELSPHVAFREIKDVFRGGSAAPCKPPQKKNPAPEVPPRRATTCVLAYKVNSRSSCFPPLSLSPNPPSLSVPIRDRAPALVLVFSLSLLRSCSISDNFAVTPFAARRIRRKGGEGEQFCHQLGRHESARRPVPRFPIRANH